MTDATLAGTLRAISATIGLEWSADHRQHVFDKLREAAGRIIELEARLSGAAGATIICATLDNGSYDDEIAALTSFEAEVRSLVSPEQGG